MHLKYLSDLVDFLKCFPHRRALLGLILIIMTQNACTQRITAPSASLQATELEAQQLYRLGLGDVVSIIVWQNADLSVDAKVRPDGKISLPLLGDIGASGLTAEELATSIKQELSHYYKDPPEVSVAVKELNSFVIYILGEVANQGKFILNSQTTFLQGLALAGGFTEFASKNNIIIRRRLENGEEVNMTFRYKDIINGKESNIALKSGDTIIVP